MDGSFNTLGGTTAAARNVISANGDVNGPGNGYERIGSDGINITASSNLIIGNYIGTNLTGDGGDGNINNGIEMSAGNNTIGGTTPGGNRKRAATTVRPFAEAGATWWLSEFDPATVSLDQVRGVLRDGPATL